MRVIGRKLRPLAQLVTRIDDLRNSAGSIAATTRTSATAGPAISAPGESAPEILLAATRGAVLSAVTVAILTVFLLAGADQCGTRCCNRLRHDVVRDAEPVFVGHAGCRVQFHPLRRSRARSFSLCWSAAA
jgi:hypothetical protein